MALQRQGRRFILSPISQVARSVASPFPLPSFAGRLYSSEQAKERAQESFFPSFEVGHEKLWAATEKLHENRYEEMRLELEKIREARKALRVAGKLSMDKAVAERKACLEKATANIVAEMEKYKNADIKYGVGSLLAVGAVTFGAGIADARSKKMKSIQNGRQCG